MNIEKITDIASRHGHVHQNLFEFATWLDRLSKNNTKRVLEIGSYRFGTAILTVECVENCVIDCVDIDDLNDNYDKYCLDYVDKIKWHRANSQDIDTLNLLYHSYDAMFIDGDHSILGVVSDYALYRHLIRPGGLIGFHDIMVDIPGGIASCVGTQLFWKELRIRFPNKTETIITDKGPWGHYGIGILTV